MWELATGKRPFSDKKHDIDLALLILEENRPPIPDVISSFYAVVMKSCWNLEPDKKTRFITIDRSV